MALRVGNKIGLFITFIFLLLLIYCLLDTDKPTSKNISKKSNTIKKLQDLLVYLIDKHGNTLNINTINNSLYLSSNDKKTPFNLMPYIESNKSTTVVAFDEDEENKFTHNNAETNKAKMSFSDKNKIILKSEFGKYLQLIYTVYHNDQYEVLMNGKYTQSNSSILKLGKKKKFYYIKFYNNYYLCTDSNGNLYADKNKDKIFFFKFKKVLLKN